MDVRIAGGIFCSWLRCAPASRASRPSTLQYTARGAPAEAQRPESQLCAIIEAQAGASAAALRVAEEHAVRLAEQPEWILSEVLLSPDLVPHILPRPAAETKDARSTPSRHKGTCRAWRRGWKETLAKRERPRRS